MKVPRRGTLASTAGMGVLLPDEDRHGVTPHALASATDAGDIVVQSEFETDPRGAFSISRWSVLDLAMKCIEHGLSSLRDLLPTLVEGAMSFRPQDLRAAAATKPFDRYFRFLLEIGYLAAIEPCDLIVCCSRSADQATGENSSERLDRELPTWAGAISQIALIASRSKGRFFSHNLSCSYQI